MSQFKALVLLSGGMDSLAVMAMAHEKWGTDLCTVHFNYGQRTFKKEGQCFEAINEHYQIPREQRFLIELPHLGALGGSSITDRNMPVSENQLDTEQIPTSYVPFRNTHFLASAVSIAEVNAIPEIHIGAVLEDETGYPDCRPEYYKAFNQLIARGSKVNTISIVTPIIYLAKDEIIQYCNQLNAPLDKTWSCYQAETVPCQKCDSCLLRAQGFKKAGLKDPLL